MTRVVQQGIVGGKLPPEGSAQERQTDEEHPGADPTGRRGSRERRAPCGVDREHDEHDELREEPLDLQEALVVVGAPQLGGREVVGRAQVREPQVAGHTCPPEQPGREGPDGCGGRGAEAECEAAAGHAAAGCSASSSSGCGSANSYGPAYG